MRYVGDAAKYAAESGIAGILCVTSEFDTPRAAVGVRPVGFCLAQLKVLQPEVVPLDSIGRSVTGSPIRASCCY